MPRPAYTIKIAKLFDVPADLDLEARYRAKHKALTEVLDADELEGYGVSPSFADCDLARLDRAFTEVKAEYEAPIAEAQAADMDRVASLLDRIPSEKLTVIDGLLRGGSAARKGFRVL